MGYQTNPFLGFEFKFDRGFDYYDYVWHEDAAKLVDRFIAALEEERPRKFMAYLHFMDVHVPYEPPWSWSSSLIGVTRAAGYRFIASANSAIRCAPAR